MPNQYVNKVVQSNGTTLIDISDTTAVAADVTSGKYFYLASGQKIAGTGSGGGGTPSQTQHTILFEFTDETTQSITGYWDSSFISDAITATIPTEYGGKTVDIASLDGVTWYEFTNIPINTQLVDYNEVRTEYTIEPNGSIVSSDAWDCVTDYLPINSTMTFSFSCSQWAYIGFYDNNKNAIRTVVADEIKTSADDYFASGTLDPSVIPPNAVYVVLRGNSYGVERLSLIRTA